MERNSINVIMELSYKTDGRKKLIFKEIAGDFFPTIFEVIPYEESEIDVRVYYSILVFNNRRKQKWKRIHL